LPAAGFANTPDPGRRLRIGYVSADFRLHAVANFALPLVEAHDRARFEVHGYASVPGADGVTRSFEAAFDAWHPIRAMSDEAAAARIRADGIDVLVDLMGLSAECRPGIFARRPAPVQVTYLGYPATTGLDCFDARLCDADTDPPGATDAFFTEPLLRLPRLFLAYRPTSPAPEPELEPPCLRNGHVTFGTFNNPAKITRRMLGTWRRVLDAVPRSRLMLRYALNDNPVVAADLARMIREAGFDEKRVLIAPPVDGQADFMATYRDLDIALDCFPYGGTTTTCEALWMGVPVVTMAGRPHASRVGMSILRAVGLGDLVTTTQGEYVAACARLAADRARLVELRAGLRGRVRASPLGDARGLAAAIETAYKELWRRWCAGAGTAGVAGAR
jgi:predicted O-linked N-acetylglucosamine transferase (SPINDLY family)